MKKNLPSNEYILIHRNINENLVVCKNPTAFYIWVKCLLRANFKDTIFYLGKKKIKLKRGQFLISYPKFSKEISISQTTLYDWISIFQKERMLERKSYSKYTVISILNYNRYQQGRKVVRKMAGKVTGKQSESKKKRKITNAFIEKMEKSEEFRWLDIEDQHKRWKDWKASKDKRFKNNQAAFRNWLRKANDFLYEKQPELKNKKKTKKKRVKDWHVEQLKKKGVLK